MSKNIAIIPARGGSKRIPRKNIKKFLKKPLISYPIEIAKKSNLFKEIFVSTRDQEIARIAKEYGAKIIYRKKELCDDYTPTFDVIKDALKQIDDKKKYQYACIIYPTSVFLQKKFLKKGLKKLKNSNCEYSFSAIEFEYPIFRGFELHSDHPKMIFPEFFNTRSQDLKKIYHDGAQFYWMKIGAKKDFAFDKNTKAVIIPKSLAVDIDDEEDFKKAEALYKFV